PADARRAKALGLLANPALACVFLAQHTPTDERATAAEQEAVDDPSPVELGAFFGRMLQELGTSVVDRLRPRSVLYVHLAEEAVQGVPGTAVARIEQHGAISLPDLTEWLGHDRI